MLWHLLIFAVGLGVLYLGAEWLVRGAVSLALKYGIRRLVVGITVVALGTSMPEFLVNFFAAFYDEDNLALGNIVGSNICNIALILGACSLLLPLTVAPSTLRKEYPIMMVVMGLFYVLAFDGMISRLDGAVLVVGLLVFMLFLVIDCRRHAHRSSSEPLTDLEQSDAEMPVWKKLVFLLGGMALLAGGARLMVNSAVFIADQMGIDHMVVGLSVVAIGTSLPELAASLVSTFKHDSDMSIGNILGSNLLNVLFVVGLVSLISPLSVDSETLTLHFPVMMGFGVLLLPLAWTSYRITRIEGGVLVTAFLGYMFYIVLPYM